MVLCAHCESNCNLNKMYYICEQTQYHRNIIPICCFECLLLYVYSIRYMEEAKKLEDEEDFPMD